jgi:hypothetical protein
MKTMENNFRSKSKSNEKKKVTRPVTVALKDSKSA